MLFVATLPLLALGYLFVSLHVLARRKPGYSHVRHTISELGEVGAPDQCFVAWGLFFPVGLALLPAGYLFQASIPAVAGLAVCIAAGYIVASFFPCDPGSPVSGSARQGIHNLGGAIEYIGGGFSLIWAAELFGFPFKLAGFAVLGAAFALTVLPSDSFRGLVQRIAEVCLFGSLACLIWLAAGV